MDGQMEMQTDTDRQRQIDGYLERYRDRQTDKQIENEIERERERERYTVIDRERREIDYFFR